VKIEWSAAALADLDRFANFLQTDFPNLAAVVAQEIIAKAEVIAANPRLGRVIDERKSFRQVVLRVLNAAYVFQYRYDGNRLVMLRIFHSRENR
jgi:plasmid stabilization system protein ParE